MNEFGTRPAAHTRAIILQTRNRAIFLGANSQSSDEALYGQATLRTGHFSTLIPFRACGAKRA